MFERVGASPSAEHAAPAIAAARADPTRIIHPSVRELDLAMFLLRAQMRLIGETGARNPKLSPSLPFWAVLGESPLQGRLLALTTPYRLP
jgi:hypothetical protein